MRTIRQQLLIGLLGGMLVSTLIAGFALYLKVHEETSELFDYQLRQIAHSLPSELAEQPKIGVAEDPEEDIIVQVWNEDGALIYASHPAHILPRYVETGFSTVATQGSHWRVFIESRHDRIVQVAQATSARDELVFGSAMRSLLPILALIPALAMLITVVVGRALQPIQRVAQALERRSASALQPLPSEGIPPEIRPIVDALNDLLARLDHALSAQRAFVADAAHELRSPLTALKLQLQLAERAQTDTQRTAAFAKLHQRLDRSTHLVQQLLTLARHESQQEQAALEPVKLALLAQGVVADYHEMAENQGIDLGVEIGAGADALTVQGHRESLRIMLSNLVDNALRYTPNGGRIDVAVLEQDGCPALQVIDNGPGIPENERPRVFDRFFRGEGSQVAGSGLGLAIVKNIADAHRAAVQVSSRPTGSGLVVTIRFPVFYGSALLHN